MIPHFTLQKGKQEYLIIRMGDEFHLIDINEALTKEKRTAVLESGCIPAQMQEMGLSGMTIPKSDIKALTVTGCGFQDDVIFWLEKRKLAFWFPKAYEQHKVDDFFRGIPRKQYKTRTRLKGGKNIDWRIREQNPELYEKLRPVGWIFNILGFGMIFLVLILKLSYRTLGWIAVGMFLIAVLLDIFLPEYFTLLYRGKRKYGEAPVRAINLMFGLLGSLYPAIIINGSVYHFFDEIRILPAALGMTLVLGAVLFLFCREFREEAGLGLLTVFLVFFYCFTAFVPHFNHVLGPELSPSTATILRERVETGGRGADRYYCTVTLPDGRELDVQVTRTEYESLGLGDTIDLQYGTGFFGIEYAIDG